MRSGDRGRPLTDVKGSLDSSEGIIADVTHVIDSGEAIQRRVEHAEQGLTWSMMVTPYRTATGQIEGATLVFTDITQALRLESELAHEKERLQMALEVARLGVWQYDVANHDIEIDENQQEFFGLDKDMVQVEELVDRIRPDDRADVQSGLARTMRGEGEFDVTFRVPRQDEEGGRVLQSVGRVFAGREGRRILGVTFDITAETEAVRVRELMLREMNHRVKNLFSIVSGMLRIAGRSADTPRDVVASVEQRISALAKSHDLTQRHAGDDPVTLEAAVRAALLPYEGAAPIEIEGPPVALKASELTSMALLLHEWATNASKYGVLGPLSGRLSVTWKRSNDGMVTILWNESYDEALTTAGETKGFGSTLVEISAVQLKGHVEVESSSRARVTKLTYTPDGE